MDLLSLPDETDLENHNTARRALVRKLRGELQEEIEEAREELEKIRQATNTARTQDLEVVKHRYRRSIAGYDQVIELLQQGTGALRAAMRDGLIIFDGHSYVFLVQASSSPLELVLMKLYVAGSIGKSFALGTDGEVCAET